MDKIARDEKAKIIALSKERNILLGGVKRSCTARIKRENKPAVPKNPPASTGAQFTKLAEAQKKKSKTKKSTKK